MVCMWLRAGYAMSGTAIAEGVGAVCGAEMGHGGGQGRGRGRQGRSRQEEKTSYLSGDLSPYAVCGTAMAYDGYVAMLCACSAVLSWCMRGYVAMRCAVLAVRNSTEKAVQY
eukprot:1801061-Rhodomonas_salina.1